MLVRAGANVGLVDLDPGVTSLAGELGPAAAGLVADVTDLPALERIAAEIVARYGRLDCAVVNAAIEPFGTIERMDPVDFDRVLEVDLGGAWRTARATIPELRRRRGYLLFVTSLAAVGAGPRNAAYNAAKAGVVSLAKTLRPVDTATGRAAMADPQIAPILARLPRSMVRGAPVGRAAP